jgi:hypothetical protein
MRDSLLNVANGQVFTNPTSTGEKSASHLDLEVDSVAAAILTDDQIEGYLNVTIISAALSSGGTEGIVLEVRNGDNSNLSASAENVGVQDIPLAKVVTGAKFSVPFKRDIAERYLGGWLRAKSTTYTGTITVDMDFADEPISENESVQKVTS